MFQLIKKHGLPALATLAMLAIASPARSAILTNAEGVSSSWSMSHSSESWARSFAPKTDPTVPSIIDGIYSPIELNSNSVPGSMSGPNSTQNHSSSGVAILPSPIKEYPNQLSIPATMRSSIVVATWCGDPMLDPPKHL